jgi:kumamolisin
VLIKSRSPERFLARALESLDFGATRHLSREEFALQYGAHPQDLALVEDFATANSLAIVDRTTGAGRLVLQGTVADVGTAFGVQLILYESGAKKYIGCQAPPCIPGGVARVIHEVFGLEGRPRYLHYGWAGGDEESARKEGPPPIYTTARDISKHYRFPSELDGKGQCVAVIAFQGGYAVDDLKQYFSGLDLPFPEMSVVSVNGARNDPLGCRYQDRLEVTGDIEVLGTIAPKAHLAVYFAPNSERGWLDVLATAIHDCVHRPSVISISWGTAEVCWTDSALRAVNDLLMQAAVLGVTVCCAAGSYGYDDGFGDGVPRVEFPASSPWVLACGGTRVDLSESGGFCEAVWNERPKGGCTGGGFSSIFTRPKWQQNIELSSRFDGADRLGRGLPDVAGAASGYTITVSGEEVIFKGSSAVAPLWAGLVALLNQRAGRPVGFLNPFLYRRAAAEGAFRDITRGDNGAYSAGRGWNACTGLGTPDAHCLMQLLADSF